MGKGWGKGHWGPPPVAAAVAAGAVAGAAVAAAAPPPRPPPHHPPPLVRKRDVAAGVAVAAVAVAAPAVAVAGGIALLTTRVLRGPRHPRPWGKGKGKGKPVVVVVAVPPGTAAGTLLQFENPRTGQLMQVAAPEGAGEEMEVRLARAGGLGLGEPEKRRSSR